MKLVTKGACWWLAILSYLGHAKSDIDLTYSLRLTSRAAFHLSSSPDLAMHRHTLDAEQKIKLGGWTAVLGARAYADSAFAMNDRYNAPVRSQESQEFTPRDVYLQYRGHGVQFRLGNQQVVWGESLGFFFADIVNPKDTREGGLGGDLEAQRIAIPMVNLIGFLGDSSLQLVYIPKPFLNLTPNPGSDFAPSLSGMFPGYTVSIQDERIRPMAWDQSEFGLRLSSLIGGWDLGVFYFYYFDRRPSYRPVFDGTEVTLRGVHDPMSSVGATATKDLGTWVARFELLYNRNRPVDAFALNNTVPTQSYYTGLSDEMVAVVGMDYTQWRDWHLSLQVSQDSYFRSIPGAFIPQHSLSLSAILGGSVLRNHEFNLIASYSPTDGGSLWQLSYMVPISSRLEASLGAYIFAGGPGSQLGAFQRANRFFIQLRGFFGGT